MSLKTSIAIDVKKPWPREIKKIGREPILESYRILEKYSFKLNCRMYMCYKILTRYPFGANAETIPKRIITT